MSTEVRGISCLNKTHFGHYGFLVSSTKHSEMFVNAARYQSWGYIRLSVGVGSEGERLGFYFSEPKQKQ